MQNEDLKQVGLKITHPRVKILQVLEESDQHHLSAEDIYKILLHSGEEIGIATIYRVLTQFEAASLVKRHHFETGQAVFELNRGHHHDHLVCVKCGKIVEFIDEEIEEKQIQIAKNYNFNITDHSLIIYGICNSKNCA